MSNTFRLAGFDVFVAKDLTKRGVRAIEAFGDAKPDETDPDGGLTPPGPGR